MQFTKKDVYTFGQNTYGELGQGDNNERSTPTLVKFCKELNVMQIAAGNELTLFVTESGEVFSSGYHESGNSSHLLESAMSNQKVGYVHKHELLSQLNIVKVFAFNGCEHVIAISSDNNVVAFGYNARGQLGVGDYQSTCIPKHIDSLNRKVVITVGCSYYHTLFACHQLETFGTGRNDYGQLGIGATDDIVVPTLITDLAGIRIIAIACGQYHTIAATESGDVFAFGKNDCGQLGIGNFGGMQRKPVIIENLKARQLACGYYHSVAISLDKKLYTWGRNDSGQLGLGEGHKEANPHIVDLLKEKECVQAACGCYHTLVTVNNAGIYSFGRNCHGQLGLKHTQDKHIFTPTLIEEFKEKEISQIAAGFYHSVVVCGEKMRNALSNDMGILVNNPRHSDVTFLVEGKSIYAHRSILIARCEPLERMVEGPLREGAEPVIPILDTSYYAFLALLEFLYTENVQGLREEEVDLNFALSVLSVADQYLLNALKFLCEEVLQNLIKLDTVSIILNTADTRRASVLKKKCIQFIISNFQNVLSTIPDDMATLPKHLIKHIFKELARRGVQVGPPA